MPSVYYAINPRGTTYDHKVTSNCTISSNVMTFTAAQTGNIGVGYKVTYNGSSVAWITEMTNGTTATVSDVQGGSVSNEGTPVTVNSIQAEYADVAAAEAGSGDSNHLNTFVLDSNTYNLFWPCYYDDDDQTHDTSEPNIDGYTTDATYFWKVYTPLGGTESINSQRHDGKWDDNKFIMEMDGADAACSLRDNYGQAVGIQVDNIDTTNAFTFNFETAGSATDLLIEKCICRTGLSGKGFWLTGSSVTVRNNLIYCRGTPNASSRAIGSIAGTNLMQYNTILNLGGGIEEDGGTTTATNNIVFNTSNDFIGTITTTYCASEDGDGSNAVTLDNGSYAFSNIWTDYSGTPRDLSLVNNTSDTNAPQNKGTFISGVDEDILGNDRDNSTPDIGAFEFVTGGGTIFDYTNTEGATASDTITGQMIENESNTEGVLGSDSNSDQLIMSESLSETANAGDTVQEILIKIESIAESILAGDTVNETSVLVESIIEGSVAADFESEQIIFTEILSEGILVSDLIQELMVFGEVTTETALAGDFDADVPTDLVEGPIKITVSVKQQGFTIESKQATISLTIKKPTFTTEIG